MRYRKLPTQIPQSFPLFRSQLFDDFLDNDLTAVASDLDMYEKDNQVVVKAEAAGFQEDDIEITIDSGVLTISGQTSSEQEEEEENKTYYIKEMSQSSFSRSVQLPTSVDEESISADYQDGIITVTMNKKQEDGKKRIKLNKGK